MNKKHLILEAAAQVVEERGAGHLTLDAVAAVAGVSKGGLLYHFPTKQALVRGMLERVIANQKNRITMSDSPHGGAHAHVLAVAQELPKSEWSSSLAILAAAAENPELLENARTYMRNVLDELRGGPHFGDAMLLVVAAEGQRIMDALGLLPLSKAERRLLSETMIERAEAASK